jgi:hypothetical protein
VEYDRRLRVRECHSRQKARTVYIEQVRPNLHSQLRDLRSKPWGVEQEAGGVKCGLSPCLVWTTRQTCDRHFHRVQESNQGTIPRKADHGFPAAVAHCGNQFEKALLGATGVAELVK